MRVADLKSVPEIGMLYAEAVRLTLELAQDAECKSD